MVGEMCPRGAAGRPAVAPLVMRSGSWIDSATELANVVERGTVPRFVVFGVDGKMSGVFDTLGLADIAIGQSVATGTYVGASPCTSVGDGGERTEDPRCGPALAGCGLALASFSHPDDPPETTAYKAAGACLQGNALAVDIDGDGVMEQFPLVRVLDGIRSPAAEWTAAPTPGATCTPTFQLYDVRLAMPPDPGKPVDPKHTVGLDVLGVVDIDHDGRTEVVLALRFPTIRTVVVYSASGSPQRLELAGEGTSFQR